VKNVAQRLESTPEAAVQHLAAAGAVQGFKKKPSRRSSGAQVAPFETTLDDVLITRELPIRRPRKRDPQKEIEAIRRLVQLFAKDSQTILSTLLEVAMMLCGAESAGISLEQLGPGETRTFCWVAAAGLFSGSVGYRSPRNASPCGVTLDREAPQLFQFPETYYAYLKASPKPIHEGLLLPWHNEDGENGTLWIVSHNLAHRFDGEDVRILSGLSSFVLIGLRQQRDARAHTSKVVLEGKAELAHEFAHKVNNPLQAASNSLFLLEQNTAGATSEFAKSARQELERIADLVKQILSMESRQPPS
jgi:hypothetical protein